MGEMSLDLAAEESCGPDVTSSGVTGDFIALFGASECGASSFSCP